MGNSEEKKEMTIEERIEELEKEVKMLVQFYKMQASINNILRFLIRKKYSEKELNSALEEFEAIEKDIKTQKRSEKEEENSEKKDEN
jgi:archaellum component FlaC